MTSHRQIFRSSAIIGGASAITMAIGIIKIKVLALMLGPAGVGLMGLYQNILSMASTLAGCGLGDSGVRQLAASEGEEATLAIVRRALWLGNLLLGSIGMLILWILREPVAQLIFENNTHASDVGWLGLGVLLNLIAGSQTALLQGLRRIGDLARVNIIGALFGTATGILLIYTLGQDGLLWFVLTAPAVSILVASYYANRLSQRQTAHDWQAIGQQWQAMLMLGVPFMAAGLLNLATQLAARTIILQELGLDASGYFQAAWAISMTYIGFVLNAMGTDYYPRLTAVANDHPQARQMVNEQSEMVLLMAGPVLVAMITVSPWVVNLLYAANFSPAADVLRWQVLGDILKISTWPMGFILLAQGRGGLFIGTQLIWDVTYLSSILLGVREWGLVTAGMGFWIAYLCLYIVNITIASRCIGFKPSRRNQLTLLLLTVGGASIMFLAAKLPLVGYFYGLVITLIAGAYSLSRLNGLVDFNAWADRKYGQYLLWLKVRRRK